VPKWLEKPVYEGGQKKPTKEEVEAEVARLQKNGKTPSIKDFVLKNIQMLKNILMVL
jgi:hypothetical protein